MGDSDHGSVSGQAQVLQKASKLPEHPSSASATELDSHTARQVELPCAQRWPGTAGEPRPPQQTLAQHRQRANSKFSRQELRSSPNFLLWLLLPPHLLLGKCNSSYLDTHFYMRFHQAGGWGFLILCNLLEWGTEVACEQRTLRRGEKNTRKPSQGSLSLFGVFCIIEVGFH